MTDSPILTIRAVDPRDHAEWQPLWEAYLAFYGASVPDDVIATTWSRLIDPEEPVNGFVAVGHAGDLVGLVHYVFHASTWTVGPYCYLQDLFVHHASRGGGVGRALIERVYEAADATGASQVYWLTQEHNVTARRLYDAIATKTDFIKYRR